jgi:hypothetical protein
MINGPKPHSIVFHFAALNQKLLALHNLATTSNVTKETLSSLCHGKRHTLIFELLPILHLTIHDLGYDPSLLLEIPPSDNI